MSANLQADSIVDLLVQILEKVRFGGVWAKLGRRYFNGCDIEYGDILVSQYILLLKLEEAEE